MTNYIKRNILNDKRLKKEIHLDEICASLQLDKTRKERMESAYLSVSTLIEADDYFKTKDALMYAYGSQPLGTISKPYGKEEFDLDFVSVISDEIEKLSPDDLLDNLYRVLYSDLRYRNKIERKRYCIRINYEGDFHMDLMPCLRIRNSERLKAADTKLSVFVDRYPKGYIKWFQSLYILDHSLLSLSDYYKLKMELRAETEVLPQSVPYQLMQPVQRTVQLIKRARDVFFEDRTDLATSSVILTTLVGKAYQGEKSIMDTMSNVVPSIRKLLEAHQYPYILEVYNPTDDNLPEHKREKLSNKWNEGAKGKAKYNAFIEFVIWLDRVWASYVSNDDKPESLLKEMFGKYPVNKALIERGRVVNSMMEKNLIGVSLINDSLTSNTASQGFKPVPKSTNHGEVF